MPLRDAPPAPSPVRKAADGPRALVMEPALWVTAGNPRVPAPAVVEPGASAGVRFGGDSWLT
jgi:hypothetical protein